MTLEEALEAAHQTCIGLDETQTTLARWKPFILAAQVAWASRLALGEAKKPEEISQEVLKMNLAFFQAADDAYRAAVSQEEK